MHVRHFGDAASESRAERPRQSTTLQIVVSSERAHSNSCFFAPYRLRLVRLDPHLWIHFLAPLAPCHCVAASQFRVRELACCGRARDPDAFALMKTAE